MWKRNKEQSRKQNLCSLEKQLQFWINNVFGHRIRYHWWHCRHFFVTVITVLYIYVYISISPSFICTLSSLVWSKFWCSKIYDKLLGKNISSCFFVQPFPLLGFVTSGSWFSTKYCYIWVINVRQIPNSNLKTYNL